MPWTETARVRYARRSSRYASDLTDREWALIAPFLPARHHVGRPRTTNLREVVNAVLYMATTGCQWAMLPKDFPPPSTVQCYFYDWRDNGFWSRVNLDLIMDARELEGRYARPKIRTKPVRLGNIKNRSKRTFSTQSPPSCHPGYENAARSIDDRYLDTAPQRSRAS